MHPVSPVIPNESDKPDPSEIIIAEHQPEYGNLPAIRIDDFIVTRWKLSAEELETVNKTGDIYLLIQSAGGPINPVLLRVEIPALHQPEIKIGDIPAKDADPAPETYESLQERLMQNAKADPYGER